MHVRLTTSTADPQLSAWMYTLITASVVMLVCDLASACGFPDSLRHCTAVTAGLCSAMAVQGCQCIYFALMVSVPAAEPAPPTRKPTVHCRH